MMIRNFLGRQKPAVGIGSPGNGSREEPVEDFQATPDELEAERMHARRRIDDDETMPRQEPTSQSLPPSPGRSVLGTKRLMTGRRDHDLENTKSRRTEQRDSARPLELKRPINPLRLRALSKSRAGSTSQSLEDSNDLSPPSQRARHSAPPDRRLQTLNEDEEFVSTQSPTAIQSRITRRTPRPRSSRARTFSPQVQLPLQPQVPPPHQQAPQSHVPLNDASAPQGIQQEEPLPAPRALKPQPTIFNIQPDLFNTASDMSHHNEPMQQDQQPYPHASAPLASQQWNYSVGAGDHYAQPGHPHQPAYSNASGAPFQSFPSSPPQPQRPLYDPHSNHMYSTNGYSNGSSIQGYSGQPPVPGYHTPAYSGQPPQGYYQNPAYVPHSYYDKRYPAQGGVPLLPSQFPDQRQFPQGRPDLNTQFMGPPSGGPNVTPQFNWNNDEQRAAQLMREEEAMAREQHVRAQRASQQPQIERVTENQENNRAPPVPNDDVLMNEQPDASTSGHGKAREDGLPPGGYSFMVPLLNQIEEYNRKMQEQSEAQQHALKQLAKNICQVTQQVSSLAETIHKSPAKEKQRKSHRRKLAGNDGMTDSDEDSKPIDVKKTHSRLLYHVRNHLKYLLGITNFKEIVKCMPLTDEEIEDINNGAPNAIQCTASKFRIDFQHRWKGFHLNEQAAEVFVQDFLASVAGGEYDTSDIPEELLVPAQIRIALDNVMEYARDRYRFWNKPDAAAKNKIDNKRKTMASRRDILLTSRKALIDRYPELLRHNKVLFDHLEAKHLSGDETEVDSNGKRVYPIVYRKIDAEWQSKELRLFFERLDQQYREDSANPVGKRATPGKPPRVILPSQGNSVDSPAPSGLPRNCYNIAWLKKLKKYQVTALKIVNVKHDLSVPDNLGDQEEEL